MTFTKISLALFAASSMLLSGTAAMAGPNGPQDFQNKPNPKFPGPGPKDFKAPPQKQGPKGNGFNPAFGVILGVSAIAAAAALADDDAQECWKEKHKGQIYVVCTEG